MANNIRSIADSYQITPPPHGRVHVLSVPVGEPGPWDETVRMACPDTPIYFDIWKVGGQYPPPVWPALMSVREIVLVNFGKLVLSLDALCWGVKYRLMPATPYDCFEVCEYCPNVNADLGMGYLSLVALTPCLWQDEHLVCSVTCSGGGGRAACLGGFNRVWSDYSWFAFVPMPPF